jgi:hypothetical protein
MSSQCWTMSQFTARLRGDAAGVGHDTPVSGQVSDNGTEHSWISVPGPGRLATGKIIKRRPSEVLRDEVVKSINRIVAVGVPRTCAKRARSSVTQGYPRSLLSCCVTKVAPGEDPLWTSSKVIMRLRFSLLYDRPLSLRDLGL